MCVPRLSCGIAFRRRLCRRPRSHLDPCTYLAPSSHSSHNKSCSLAHLTTRIVVAVADADVVVAGGAAAASLQFRCCCCCCELLLKKNYNVDKLKADRLGGGGRDRALEQCETRTQTLKWPLSASSCGPRNATPCHAMPRQAKPSHATPRRLALHCGNRIAFFAFAISKVVDAATWHFQYFRKRRKKKKQTSRRLSFGNSILEELA